MTGSGPHHNQFSPPLRAPERSRKLLRGLCGAGNPGPCGDNRRFGEAGLLDQSGLGATGGAVEIITQSHTSQGKAFLTIVKNTSHTDGQEFVLARIYTGMAEMY